MEREPSVTSWEALEKLQKIFSLDAGALIYDYLRDVIRRIPLPAGETRARARIARLFEELSDVAIDSLDALTASEVETLVSRRPDGELELARGGEWKLVIVGDGTFLLDSNDFFK